MQRGPCEGIQVIESNGFVKGKWATQWWTCRCEQMASLDVGRAVARFSSSHHDSCGTSGFDSLMAVSDRPTYTVFPFSLWPWFAPGA
jgi:hypothetical protein